MDTAAGLASCSAVARLLATQASRSAQPDWDGLDCGELGAHVAAVVRFGALEVEASWQRSSGRRHRTSGPTGRGPRDGRIRGRMRGRGTRGACRGERSGLAPCSAP